MAFWGIQVKPGKPFTLKFDDGLRRRLHISQATLAIGPSKQTSLVQCNLGDKSPVLLCALLPDKSESLQLNLEFDEHEEVLFSVIGPRAVHLTGFYTGVGRNFNDDDSESYGEDIANSENEEPVAQSDEDEYEDSFIDDDDDLKVLPPFPESTDGVDGDDKKRNKKNTKKRLKKNTKKLLKKRSQVVESDDESISWKQNTGSCIRIVYVSDSEDGFPNSSVLKNKEPAKNIVSESNACGDASNLMADGPVRNDDPKRTMPKKKSEGAANKGNTFEADPANHSNEGDEIKQSEEKTNDIAFGQDPIVTNEIDNDPGMNMTLQKEKGKVTSNEEKFFEADATDHSNPDDKAKKSELKTNDIAVYQDQIVGNEIRVDPGTNKTTSKKKGKGVCHGVQILEADAADHSNPDHKAKKSVAKTNAIAINQDPIVTNEIDVDPVTNKRSNLLPSSELGLESGAKPKKKRKERSKEEKIPEANTDNHLKSFNEKNYLQADTGADDMDQDLHLGKENVRRLSNKTETGFSAASLHRTVEEGSDKPKKKRRKREQEQKTPAENELVVPERKADENTSEKAAKKKKQKSKVQKNDDNVDVPVSLNGEKENSINEVQDENVISGSSQQRTLSNGLVIEDLESSKSDGKAAALGRKLKVQYTAKLKENGEIIDSNGKAPYRFRLGGKDVMEGWNIGLDGMRAGDKRRLVVPPSLGNGSRGTAENVPPDSWVIYDVELLSVH